MKETVCYVADDYMRELYRVNDCDVTLEQHYTLPDGHVVSVGSERFRSVFQLFVICSSSYFRTFLSVCVMRQMTGGYTYRFDIAGVRRRCFNHVFSAESKSACIVPFTAALRR